MFDIQGEHLETPPKPQYWDTSKIWEGIYICLYWRSPFAKLRSYLYLSKLPARKLSSQGPDFGPQSENYTWDNCWAFSISAPFRWTFFLIRFSTDFCCNSKVEAVTLCFSIVFTSISACLHQSAHARLYQESAQKLVGKDWKVARKAANLFARNREMLEIPSGEQSGLKSWRGGFAN